MLLSYHLVEKAEFFSYFSKKLAGKFADGPFKTWEEVQKRVFYKF